MNVLLKEQVIASERRVLVWMNIETCALSLETANLGWKSEFTMARDRMCLNLKHPFHAACALPHPTPTNLY